MSQTAADIAIETFVTRVAASDPAGPGLRRVTLAGGDLHRFVSLGPETFVYVLAPPPGRNELTIDRSFTWEGYQEMPEADRPVGAYYTVRHWRPERAEIDLDVVLHEPAGAGSRWASTARAGDPVAVWGPRRSFAPPPDTAHLLLVADDTGLPAVATILDARTAGMTAMVVAEVDAPAHRPELADGSGVTVHWLYRRGASPGTTRDGLGEAVRALGPHPPGTYAWGGGESRAMTLVRRYLRQQLGWPPERVDMIAYWRHNDSPLEETE
jgi:NADPH-dependent ferric siderophore reductase